MTKYAVELFFDERTEQYIRGLWRELEQNGITDSMMSIAEIQPHLTVAVYDDLEAGEFEEEIAFFYAGGSFAAGTLRQPCLLSGLGNAVPLSRCHGGSDAAASTVSQPLP